MRVLVCGGAGYIGSHACVVLAERGHEVVIADNFSNSSKGVLAPLRQLTGSQFEVQEVDLCDREGLRSLLGRGRFDAVIHFAALKAVGESVRSPLRYYDNNVVGTVNLLHAMQVAGVKNLVFSSSATVYGDPRSVPVNEAAPLGAKNPYGRSKLMCEEMIKDHSASDPCFRAAVLRYFNPVGAHPSGLIGEDPRGVPNNLMPIICKVAAGKLRELTVFGGDWPTPDGTGVRDYIHVMDLVRAHVDAVERLMSGRRDFTLNLGVGRGVSVLELVRAFERVSQRRIPYKVASRREGDAASVYADPSAAYALLRWRAEADIDVMCRDAWRWQLKNPDGFVSFPSR